MNNNLTDKQKLERLILAIRNSEYLSDIKKIVGADDEELAMSKKRIERIEELENKYGRLNSANEIMPNHIKVKLKHLHMQQSKFESFYC